MPDLLILGGGIAGLSSAWTAGENRLSSQILEGRSQAGGILDSFVVDGFRFDNGVHLSFACEPEVRDVFDRTPYSSHDAVSFCWDGGIWLRHPIQNNLFPLSVEDRVGLIEGLVQQKPGEIKNYRDWLIYQYGTPIAARWPLVYTEKYWTLPAEQLGTNWIGQRMRQADLREVLVGAMAERAPNTYYISQMRYPQRGGYRAFIEPMIEAANIRLDARVVEVDASRRVVQIQNGETIPFRYLINTLPLPNLVAMMTDVPESIRADAETLFATSVDLISVALSNKKVSPSLWFYIYDQDILAARVYSPTWKSADNAPAGCSSLQFEIYSSMYRPQQATVAEMIDNCLDAMTRMGLADRNDVIFTHHKHLPFANVVFDLDMETRRDRVRTWVESKGIGLAGRFGEWAYLWSNQSFMSGRRAVLDLLANSSL